MVHLVPTPFDPAEGITGGAERYAHELARYMARRIPTRLVTFGRSAVTAREGDLEIRRLGPSRFVRGQRTNPFHRSMFRELRWADVIHCHQQHVVASSLAALYARAARRRVVVSDLGGGGWDVSGYVSTDRWYHGHLHLSEYSRRVAGHERWSRAHVVYGGVDLERFSPAGGERSGALFVGRLLPHKGVDLLIEALPAGMRLRIVGAALDGGYLALLRELATGKDVEFLHDVDDRRLVALYRSARCLVLPSLYRDRFGATTAVPELLGQVALEALACATPVIATDVASLPEVVTHEVDGLLVAPNDVGALRGALERIAMDSEGMTAMGRRGRAKIEERFTWEATVDRCLAAYGVA